MIQYSVSVDTDALVDIERTKNWYYNQSPARGEKFDTQVIQHVYSLRENPDFHAIRYGKVRCISVESFPFQIFFTINEFNKTVRILNVLHKNRSPKHWPRL